MKKLLLSAVMMSSMAVMAQAPAVRAPRPPGLALTSTGIPDGGVIPDKYSQASPTGAVSPPLAWTNVPEGTVSFALITYDPDSPVAKTNTVTLHWLVFNIPGTVRSLPESVPNVATLPDGTIQAHSQRGIVGYAGMGAAANGPYHHYTWALFALDTKLSLTPDATQKEVEAAMEGHILGKGILSARFHRPS